jgi:hypothetical protein
LWYGKSVGWGEMGDYDKKAANNSHGQRVYLLLESRGCGF